MAKGIKVRLVTHPNASVLFYLNIPFCSTDIHASLVMYCLREEIEGASRISSLNLGKSPQFDVNFPFTVFEIAFWSHIHRSISVCKVVQNRGVVMCKVILTNITL